MPSRLHRTQSHLHRLHGSGQFAVDPEGGADSVADREESVDEEEGEAANAEVEDTGDCVGEGVFE